MTVEHSFTDTHNHIIPAIDDGSPDLETSVAMARIAAADGITSIVVTPHLVEGFYEGDDIPARVESLQRELEAQGIPIRLLPGAEVPLSICLSAGAERLRRLAIGGSYLLIESAETTLDQIAQAVYQVRLSGLTPVLAHPERTSFAEKDIASLQEIAERREAYFQMTVASLEGVFGRQVHRNCRRMLSRGIVHLIATDAHSLRKRPPLLSPSYQKLRHLVGDEAARIICIENPAALAAGSPLTLLPPASGRRGLIARLFPGA